MARTSILADYRRLALSLHLDPLSLMRRAGIDRRLLQDPELLFTMRSMIELLELTAREGNIEDFGLRLGEARGLPDLGPVSLMLREQATVGMRCEHSSDFFTFTHTPSICTWKTVTSRSSRSI